MHPDSRFDRLRSLAAGESSSFDEATLPPEAFEAWRSTGLKFGKFVLLDELGRGGTSVVYRAWQADLRREVALKVVSGVNPELRDRFLREARIGAQLSHPAILPVFDAGETDGSLWLAMPRVEGATLDACAMSPVEAARAVAAAARGVEAAHRAGVVHRDLKPRNIMRDTNGAVHVMDFGLALSREDATRISVTGQILGTPQYMAPEQAAGRPADARTDVYGLGATLYRLAAGKAPYEATSLPELLSSIAATDPPAPSSVTSISAPLETVILKAMNRDPDRRYASASDFADDLERFARGDAVLARREPLLRRLARALKRRRVETSAALAAIVLFTVATYRRDELLGNHPKEDPTRALGEEATRLVNRGQYPEALQIMSRMLEMKPGDFSILEGRAQINMQLSRWKEAAADLTTVLAQQPERIPTRSNRAYCRRLQMDLDGAEADYRHILAVDPGHAEALLGRARINDERHAYDAALVDENSVLSRDPGNCIAHATRAYTLLQLGRFRDSLADYDEAIRSGGPQTKWLVARGHTRLLVNDGAGALADLEAAIAADPGLKDGVEGDLLAAREMIASGSK